MFFRILKRAFWIFYDNLFKGALLNMLLFLLLLLAFVVGIMKMKMYLETAAVIGALWHMLVPGLIYYWIKVIRNEDPDGMIRTIGSGIKQFWYKGLLMFVLNSAFYVLAFISINFYKNISGSGQWAYVLGGIGLWIVLMFLLLQVFLMPIMVLDEKKRVFISYKKALIMILSAPFSTLFIIMLIGFFDLVLYPILHFQGAHPPVYIALFSLFPIFLMPFISYTFIILMQISATMLIYEKHKIFEPLDKVWEDRTFSNLFKPWETKVK